MFIAGHEGAVRLLIENGINLNRVNNVNNSALILAINGGNLQRNYWSILIWCFSEIQFSSLGYDKIAELLIEKGADIDIVGNGGLTALSVAAGRGKLKFLDLSKIVSNI